MRIALFTDSFHPELGGIQDAVACQGRALGQRGHAVLIVAPRPASEDYRRAGLGADAASDEQLFGERISITRWPSIPIPGSTQQSRLMIPWNRWRSPRPVIDRFRPDIVHLHTFLTAGREALAEARRRALPVVGTNHWAVDSFDMYGPQRLARLVARQAGRWVNRFYQRCTTVTVPSAELRDAMRAQGFNGDATVISNPIDTRLYRPAAPLERGRLRARLGLNGPSLIYAGRLAREKRIDILIEAVARLSQGRDGPELLLAGQGSDLDRLQRKAIDCGVADRVRFCGSLSQTALAEHFRAADLFVTASTTETQCMALLQAMASGLPAVVADARALPETLGPEAGRLARSGDPHSFAEQIAALLGAPTALIGLGHAARARATRCSTDTVTDQWETHYARLIG